MPRTLGGRVAFPVSRAVAFDYLADPIHRPEWQSSLARVSQVVGEPGEGQTWVDETKPGLHPRMRTTAYVRPSRWAESGTWRFVRADLTLDFEEPPASEPPGSEPPGSEPPGSGGCVVAYRFRIHLFGPVGVLATLGSLPAVGADLRRAARVLADRPAG